VQERIVRDLSLKKGEVVTIGSWSTIRDAVEHIPGATFVNTGNTPLSDGTDDPVFADLNQKQAGDPFPEMGVRSDKYTFGHAIHYLNKHRPRFMFISLNDSDHWAHENQYPKYIEALEQYDRWIRDLKNALDDLGEYGKSTTLLVTTDHGRGHGSYWAGHGVTHPESSYVWLYGHNPDSKVKGTSFESEYTHADIRPTIETIMGLKPQSCNKCGRLIQELIQDH
jgi:bisphosphoglycerate-independent phosphoglycerate mutase (AlkP superfamily)